MDWARSAAEHGARYARLVLAVVESLDGQRHRSRRSCPRGRALPDRLKVAGLPTLPRPRTRTLRLPTRDFFGVVVVIAWSVIALLFHEHFYDNYAVFASVVILAAAVAFYRWEPAQGREGYRLLGFFVCGQAFLSSGISVLNRVDVNPLLSTPTEEAFSAAVESTVVFALMFLLGALATSPRKGESLAHPPAVTSGPTRIVALILAALTTLLTVSYLRSGPGPLGTLPLVFLNIGILGPTLVAQSALTGRRTIIPLAVLFLGQAIAVFYSSMLGLLVLPLRDLLLARIYLRKSLPMLLIGGMTAGVIILNPVKHLFRGAVAEGAPVGFDQTYAVWGDAVSTTWNSQGHTQSDRKAGLESSTSRLDYNWIAAHVFRTVPRRLPFEMGQTYAPLATILIPRVIYPDKPDSSEYGRGKWMVKLGVQTRAGTKTAAFALPAPAEAYWNFGWLGVFTVPVALGALVGLMLRWGPKDPVVRVGYVVLVATSLGQFLDMVIWIVPAFIAVAGSGIFTAFCSRIGKRALRQKSKKASPPAIVAPAE